MLAPCFRMLQLYTRTTISVHMEGLWHHMKMVYIVWFEKAEPTEIVSSLKFPVRYRWSKHVFPTAAEPKMITFTSLNKMESAQLIYIQLAGGGKPCKINYWKALMQINFN